VRGAWGAVEHEKAKLEMQVSADGFTADSKGKDILAYGGPTFASSLINAGSIDEFHLLVNPTALGSGTPMFKDLAHSVRLRLVGATAFECGVAVLEYVSPSQ